MDRRVAVTGAAGFQGRYLVEALRAAGRQVVAVVREADRRPWLATTSGVEVRVADLLDPSALRAAFDGVGPVIHCGGLASPKHRGWAENHAANVEGTDNVIAAAAEAGVPRLVVFSTIGTYRVLPQHLRGAVLTEDHPLLTEAQLRLAGAYRVSKALSERAVMEACPRLGLPWVILRSAATFGRSDPNVMPLLGRWTARAVVPLPRARFPIVFAGDVAEAAVRACDTPAAVNRAYNLSCEPDRSFGDVVEAYLAATGRTARSFHIPPPWGLAFDSSAAARDLAWSSRPLSEAFPLALSTWGPVR